MLNNIIQQQKIDMANREKTLPYEKLSRLLKKSTRDFAGALQKKSPAFIFECKHYSPSEGKLCDKYPITQLAQSYSQFADAISVLANAPFFGGSYEHLTLVSQTVDKPVLCKDIIINPYQVALARLHGADAVLLMLSVLDDAQYLACLAQAQRLNMSVLTEIFSIDEAIRAINLKAKIIGINHRDLHTMTLDMERAKQLAPLFPKETIIIAASGIKSHQDIQSLNPFVHGFLIGSSLSKSENLEITVRELVFGAVKICGLTRKQDVIKAYQSGASYGGFIFAENSPRKITLEQALDIAVAPLNYVGVFLGQPIELITATAIKLNLHAIQLHGYNDSQIISHLRKQLPLSCQIWVAMDGHDPLPTKLPKYVDKIVVDSLTKHQSGGTGKPFNWDHIRKSPLLPHLILAGGLSCENIMQAQKLGTWGIDINSNIELIPGIKDPLLIDKLFAQLRKKERPC